MALRLNDDLDRYLMETDAGGPSETAYKGGDPVPPANYPKNTTGAAETQGYSYPTAPSYNYVPGTFNYEYGYAPSQFSGQYGYTPSKFEGQYGYKPTQFQYQSQYADLINAARDRIHNWNYDPEQDVSYNAYKNQYTRAGKQAYTDALAKYATHTGGVASSYAASAAQQQYNNYMAQLAAKVPELEQLAYNRAQNELNDYIRADESDYNRAFSEYSDWENRQRAQADTEYENAWNQYMDWENRQRAAADTEYNNAWNQYTDWEDRQRTQADTEYDIAYQKWQLEENARQQAAENAYNNALAQYNAQVSQIKAAQNAASAAAKQSTGSTEKSGTTGTGSNKKTTVTATDTTDKEYQTRLAKYESQAKSMKEKDPVGAVEYLTGLFNEGLLEAADYNDLITTYNLGKAYDEYKQNKFYEENPDLYKRRNSGTAYK